MPLLHCCNPSLSMAWGAIYSANPKWSEIANFRPVTLCIAKLTWFTSSHKPAASPSKSRDKSQLSCDLCKTSTYRHSTTAAGSSDIASDGVALYAEVTQSQVTLSTISQSWPVRRQNSEKIQNELWPHVINESWRSVPSSKCFAALIYFISLTTLSVSHPTQCRMAEQLHNIQSISKSLLHYSKPRLLVKIHRALHNNTGIKNCNGCGKTKSGKTERTKKIFTQNSRDLN